MVNRAAGSQSSGLQITLSPSAAQILGRCRSRLLPGPVKRDRRKKPDLAEQDTYKTPMEPAPYGDRDENRDAGPYDPRSPLEFPGPVKEDSGRQEQDEREGVEREHLGLKERILTNRPNARTAWPFHLSFSMSSTLWSAAPGGCADNQRLFWLHMR